MLVRILNELHTNVRITINVPNILGAFVERRHLRASTKSMLFQRIRHELIKNVDSIKHIGLSIRRRTVT